MKTSRMFVVCLHLVMLLFGLASCSGASQSKTAVFTFRQERSDIEKIEICKYDHYTGTREPLVELSQNDIDTLCADVSSLEIQQFLALDPILSYGDVVIFISYFDGESEMIGITNIGWLSADGKLHTTNSRFAIKEICAVIAKYVDAEALADASEYFTKPLDSTR